jgi:DNA-directed RNA polymerase subunit RPC12/RpoP
LTWHETNLERGLRRLDALILANREDRLRTALQDLRIADPAGNRGPLVLVEVGIRDLEEVSPENALLAQARGAAAAFAERFESALPPLREIGEVGDTCPTCAAALARRPQRKAKCPHCSAFIFCRTRPLDGAQVLLNEAEARDLEKDWAVDYQMKQRQPRPVDPVWAARLAEAAAAGPDLDPAVEAAAQRVAAEVVRASPGSAPRDTRDRQLALIADAEFRARVDRRSWQILVQGISGGPMGDRTSSSEPAT